MFLRCFLFFNLGQFSLLFAAFSSSKFWWYFCMVFLLHFGTKISHLHAHLAFGFWFLASGFVFWHLVFRVWLWCHLAFGNLVVFFFVFWLWFHSVFGFIIWLHLHATCHIVHYIAYKLHVNCTETKGIYYRNFYACCCQRNRDLLSTSVLTFPKYFLFLIFL